MRFCCCCWYSAFILILFKCKIWVVYVIKLAWRVFKQQVGWFEDEGMCVRCVAYRCLLVIPPANFQVKYAFRAARKCFHKICWQLNDNTIEALFYRLSPLKKIKLHFEFFRTVFILCSFFFLINLCFTNFIY